MARDAAVDLILHRGRVRTQDLAAPEATAIAVGAGRIVAVGEDKAISGLGSRDTPRVDLGGATVVPGLIDAHAHIWKMGHLLTSMVDLRHAHSIPELAQLLGRAAARLPPGAWLLGRGFNEANLREGRAPVRHDLDLVANNRPIVLTRTCGHIYAVNGAALATCGITRSTEPPPGGVVDRDATGDPTGILRETAMGLVNAHLPPPTAAEHTAMIEAALRHQLELGITSTCDAGVSPALLEVYRAMDARGALPIHVNVMALRKVDGVGVVPLGRTTVGDRLRIDTAKFLADGGLSGATAALSQPYRHTKGEGVLRFEDAELLALAREAQEAGWRIATHAIGDVAIDQVLEVYEALGRNGVRHRIEHLGLPSAAQLARAAALDVIAVPQSVFLHELGRNFRAALPDSFLPRTYPIRDMVDAGLTVALSSDAPVVEDDGIFRGIQSAVDRLDDEGVAIAPGQSITAAEALYAYTMGGAIACGEDAQRGSITAGKRADFAVLSGDPLTTETAALATITVDQTWVAGRLAYER
ncbi:MAG: amidohydrolase [Gemmatimonadota bacterium]|nr:amidohydrolase [Gemmatimonadota bacterium]